MALYTNDLSRALDGADSLKIDVAVPGIKGTMGWRAARSMLSDALRDVMDATLRWLVFGDQEVTSVLICPDKAPGRTLLLVVRHQQFEPRTLRVALDDNQLVSRFEQPTMTDYYGE